MVFEGEAPPRMVVFFSGSRLDGIHEKGVLNIPVPLLPFLVIVGVFV